MADDETQPIGRVLGDGFGIAPLPSGWTALEGVVLVKCLDVDGQPSWAFRHTSGLNHEETIGALTVHLDLMRDEISDLFRPGDSDTD
ncbi:MAG TPA: hypothetical protein VGH43_10120 [Jatrophihabitans sp.]|jgi:hypothetical protein